MSLLTQTVVYAVEPSTKTVFKMIDYGDYVVATKVADFSDLHVAKDYCLMKNATEQIQVTV